MKQLNGKPIVRFSILAHLECTPEQADYILGAPNAVEQKIRYAELIHSLNPVNEAVYDGAIADFKQDVGKCMVAQRERELKQLAAPEPAPLMEGA